MDKYEAARARAQRNANTFQHPYWAVRHRVGCYEFSTVTLRPERLDRIVESAVFFPAAAR